MKNLLYLALFLLVACTNQTVEKQQFPNLSGPYFGQELPGDSAVLFAPDIVSTGAQERDLVFTPDGQELFFVRSVGRLYSTIFYSKIENDKWQKPEVFKYCTNAKYKFLEPFLTPDGKKLFFITDMPESGTNPTSFDIWITEKNEQNEWTEPYKLDGPVNTAEDDYFPSITSDGTIYYTALDTVSKQEFIYRSRLVDGQYAQPEKLNEKVNGGRARFNATIASDESYIIVPTFGTQDAPRNTNYFIVFRNEDDQWSEPINMEPYINSEGGWSASISADQKYLFFMASKTDKKDNIMLTEDKLKELYNAPQNGNPDIYWIKADFIEDLRKQAKF
ncbi:MAG: hypothetical protein KQH79_09820 [Bacteroidetes bacterium]|nr:hypothetical protein [Bacteroidota bacterium]